MIWAPKPAITRTLAFDREAFVFNRQMRGAPGLVLQIISSCQNPYISNRALGTV